MADDLDFAAAIAGQLARVATALHAFVQDVPAALSQERVPRDTEALANSMRVSDPVIDATGVAVTLSYGNADDQTGIYAIVQEMRDDLRHPNGGQAHYLESSAVESAPLLMAGVAARMEG